MRKFNRFFETFPQLVATLSGSLGVVSDGMNYAWTAPVLPTLERNSSQFHISESDHIWLEYIYFIGGICGLPLTVYCINEIGRKRSIIISAIVALVSWSLLAFEDNVIYLYAARFIVGISGVVNLIATPIYIAEIADKNIRGFLAALVYVMLILGILAIYSIAPFFPIYVPSIFGGSLVIIQLISFPYMPDSPYYLILRGNVNKAREHLQRLRNSGHVETELKEIVDAVKRQESEKGRLQDLLLVKSNRKGVLIMLVLNGAQHFSGISVFLMNIHDILQEANSIYLSQEITGICFAILMLLAAIISDFNVDKFGRKSLLIVSSCLSSLSLLTLAVYFTFQKLDTDVSEISWLPVVAVMTYAFVFKLGLGLIPIILTAELFPCNVKAIGMSVSDLFYVLFGLFSVQVYLILSPWIGFDTPFYIFSICCISTAVFAHIYIPETNGKTLEEIQFILKNIPCPKQTSPVI